MCRSNLSDGASSAATPILQTLFVVAAPDSLLLYMRGHDMFCIFLLSDLTCFTKETPDDVL